MPSTLTGPSGSIALMMIRCEGGVIVDSPVMMHNYVYLYDMLCAYFGVDEYKYAIWQEVSEDDPDTIEPISLLSSKRTILFMGPFDGPKDTYEGWHRSPEVKDAIAEFGGTVAILGSFLVPLMPDKMPAEDADYLSVLRYWADEENKVKFEADWKAMGPLFERYRSVGYDGAWVCGGEWNEQDVDLDRMAEQEEEEALEAAERTGKSDSGRSMDGGTKHLEEMEGLSDGLGVLMHENGVSRHGCGEARKEGGDNVSGFVGLVEYRTREDQESVLLDSMVGIRDGDAIWKPFADSFKTCRRTQMIHLKRIHIDLSDRPEDSEHEDDQEDREDESADGEGEVKGETHSRTHHDTDDQKTERRAL